MLLFAILFLVVYLVPAYRKLIPYLQVSTSVKKLSRFINAYENSRRIEREEESLLKYFPVIKKYERRYRLEYGATPQALKWNADKIFNSLRMVRNEKWIELKCTLNPLSAIGSVFYLPGNLAYRRRNTQNHSVFSLLLHLALWAGEFLLEHILGFGLDSFLIPYIQSIYQNSPK